MLALLGTVGRDVVAGWGGCNDVELDGSEGGKVLEGAREVVDFPFMAFFGGKLWSFAGLLASPDFPLAAPPPLALPTVVALGLENVANTPSFVLRLIVGLARGVFWLNRLCAVIRLAPADEIE